jgi:glucose/mannose-6-phosphate isomerase
LEVTSELRQERLDDREYVNSLDAFGMLHLIESMPEQIRKACRFAPDRTLAFSSVPRAIGVVGVGSTTVCAELLSSIADQHGTTPVVAMNSYDIPRWVGRDTLLVFISFSGNTEETCACFAQSLENSCSKLVITSGGHLAEIAVDNSVPVVRIPREKPANRTVFPYMFIPLLNAAADAGSIDGSYLAVEDAADFLANCRGSFGVGSPMESNIAKKVASSCSGRIPLIYSGDPSLRGVALRWEYQLNENSKAFAHSTWFPEASHNEMVGLTGDDMSHEFAPIVLFDESAAGLSKERLNVTRAMLKQNGNETCDVPIKGNSLLHRLLYGVFLADYVSFYLAILRGLDPHAVDVIDQIRLGAKERV